MLRVKPAIRRRPIPLLLVPLLPLLLVALEGHSEHYDPLAVAQASIGAGGNLEASVPPQCYTKTDGVANPCWTCHTVPVAPNHMDDSGLQKEYAFSDQALSNHWTNLSVDRTEAVLAISDPDILAWIRSDNLTPLRKAMAEAKDFEGYVPDLDLAAGFDASGFAVDGSGWRAIRFKPFPGTFWPTNGSTSDVMVRLPRMFRRDAEGRPSRLVYQANFALLEAVIAADPRRPDHALDRSIEPIDEERLGFDVDGDGQIEGVVQKVVRLPRHYLGQAKDVQVQRYVFPEGTEFLHTVRYVDPDAPSLLSTRLKELRYMKKVRLLDAWAMVRAYEIEVDEKERGRLPQYAGSPLSGLVGSYGWQLQGFIEDHHGRLRLQTEEEHRYCMGCHGALGITVDHTFAFARKVPGREGFRHQDLAGMKDVPQIGHQKPEILTYFERALGGDEFRHNAEILDRFFNDGRPNEAQVRRAAVGGDQDLRFLIEPSRARALQLNKTYLTIVHEQSFARGRDAISGPVRLVHTRIENGDTGLSAAGMVFTDGRLWLDW